MFRSKKRQRTCSSQRTLSFERLENRELLAIDFELLKDFETPPRELFTNTSFRRPHNLVESGQYAYFNIGNDSSTQGLWRTDGTLEGTSPQLLRNQNLDVTALQSVGDQIFFGIRNVLYRSDGTEAGTIAIKEFTSTGQHATVLDDRYVFLANSGLWISDGTEAGTNYLGGPVQRDPELWTVGSQVFVGGSKSDVWVTDGTPQGTRRLFDIDDQFGSANHLENFEQVGDQVFFFAVTENEGRELYVTDGTEAGTRFLKDIYPGPRGAIWGTNMVELQGRLYFAAEDPDHGKSIWTSDGTPEGTRLFKSGLTDDFFFDFDNRLYFIREAAIHQPPGLYRIEPDGGNEQFLGDIRYLDNAIKLHNRLYFTGSETSKYRHSLWYLDMEEDRPQILSLASATQSTEPVFAQTIFRLGDELLVFPMVGGKDAFPLTIDRNKRPSMDVIVPETGPIPAFLAELSDNRFLFSAKTIHPNRLNSASFEILWISGGTADTTVPLRSNDGRLLSVPTRPVRLGEELFFAAAACDENGFGCKTRLWLTDGTSEGTRPIYPYSVVFIKLINAVSAGKYVYLLDSERWLWVTDGTEAGTRRISYQPEASHLAAIDDKVFFRGPDQELWISDGTRSGTHQLKDIHPTGESRPAKLFVHQGQLYFRADDGEHGTELWTSDGTEAGTKLFLDSRPGRGGNTFYFVSAGEYLYFGGSQGFDKDLWRTDGTADGTVLVARGYWINSWYPLADNQLVFTAGEPGDPATAYLTSGEPGDVRAFSQRNEGVELIGAPIFARDDTVYFAGSAGNRFYPENPFFSTTGTELWEANLNTLLYESSYHFGEGAFPGLGIGTIQPYGPWMFEMNGRLFAIAQSLQHGVQIFMEKNESPIDVQLSNATIDENLSVGSLVGALLETDANPDYWDPRSFRLVAGVGDTHNRFFDIVGSQLLTAKVLDYELHSTLSVRVQVTDSQDNVFEKPLTIVINDRQDPPRSIALSKSVVAENSPVGTEVGRLTVVDPTLKEPEAFELIEGLGSQDNGSFFILGHILYTSRPFDFEARPDFSVRVRAVDSSGRSVEQFFNVLVNDINESPASPRLVAAILAENSPPGSLAGTLNSTDPDANDQLTFSLSQGDGDGDNSLFTIHGSELRANTVFDYEQRATYSIRVRAEDLSGSFSESIIEINIADTNDPPHSLSLSSTSIAENMKTKTTVGLLSAEDQDHVSFTFQMIEWYFYPDNRWFGIVGNQLRLSQQLDYETRSIYTVGIRVSDRYGGILEREFEITVLDVPNVDEDVNSDESVTPLDALMVINFLNQQVTSTVPAGTRLDVNQDGSITPLDALIIINYVNQSQASGEGELTRMPAAYVAAFTFGYKDEKQGTCSDELGYLSARLKLVPYLRALLQSWQSIDLR